jgi:hypothetical protein
MVLQSAFCAKRLSTLLAFKRPLAVGQMNGFVQFQFLFGVKTLRTLGTVKYLRRFNVYSMLRFHMIVVGGLFITNLLAQLAGPTKQMDKSK